MATWTGPTLRASKDPRFGTLAVVLLACHVVASVARAEETKPMYVSSSAPPVECVTRVNFGADAELPGYFVQDPAGKVCVPFTYQARFAPLDYHGDYFVAEFTDAKVKAKYQACTKDLARVVRS